PRNFPVPNFLVGWSVASCGAKEINGGGVTRLRRLSNEHLSPIAFGVQKRATCSCIQWCPSRAQSPFIIAKTGSFVGLRNVLAEEIFPNCVLVVSSASDLIH